MTSSSSGSGSQPAKGGCSACAVSEEAASPGEMAGAISGMLAVVMTALGRRKRRRGQVQP